MFNRVPRARARSPRQQAKSRPGETLRCGERNCLSSTLTARGVCRGFADAQTSDIPDTERSFLLGRRDPCRFSSRGTFVQAFLKYAVSAVVIHNAPRFSLGLDRSDLWNRHRGDSLSKRSVPPAWSCGCRRGQRTASWASWPPLKCSRQAAAAYGAIGDMPKALWRCRIPLQGRVDRMRPQLSVLV